MSVYPESPRVSWRPKGLRINKVYISTHEAKLNSSSLHEKLLAPS